MTDVFVLRNQHNEYLSKSLEWLSAGDSKTLYRTEHRDEVINQKVELTVKRPDLRISAIAAEQASNGRILINNEDCLPKAQTKLNQEQACINTEVVANPADGLFESISPEQDTLEQDTSETTDLDSGIATAEDIKSNDVCSQ